MQSDSYSRHYYQTLELTDVTFYKAFKQPPISRSIQGLNDKKAE